MRKRRITAALLSLLLLLCLTPTAAGASAPSVTYRPGSGGVSLQVNGVDGGVYGAQLTLTVPGSHPDAVFTPADRDAYSPDCQVEVGGNRTEITIYLTAENPLNSGSTLSLGTLTDGGSTLDASGILTLLGRDLREMAGAGGVDVTVRAASSGTTSRPGTGSSRPSGANQSGGQEDKNTPSQQEEKPDYASVALPFRDTPANEWYYSAVQYVYANGMMSGTAGDTFSPNAPTTRGMIVTILHRLEGSPAAGRPVTFPDVDPSLYYAAPIAWASAAGLVNGYDTGGFGPEDPITREQLAAILCRYAASKSYDVSARGSLAAFRDASALNDYAVEPVRWAVGAGLISGMDDGTISPAGRATRAQVATILMRFCEKV